ncbi:FAD-dependent oxidoreductase [Pararhizobium sp. YC-54]|uniref:flavin monoamine oxidase family protein n=1 Tax=Pararhizobium sp. YC-54 TaxID=2986920 RepID=UPI0021F7E25E|nr:NAD(P)/FAD-dependent oxidoreductase [Pararhizobium sp. YC-54]MCW0001342.1 FAD-dependent oxidoreductase [Pararhizobium sp. YC-54]
MDSITDIVVVGAGAAGISAMRVLARANCTSLLLEASPRIGGRAWTVMPKREQHVDLGCGWLHSAEQNPWVQVAEEAGVSVDRRQAAWGKQYQNLDFNPEEQKAARKFLRDWNSEMWERPPETDSAWDAASRVEGVERWRPYLERVVGAVSGKRLDEVSVTDFMNYHQASTEADWRLPVGFGHLVAASLPREANTLVATPVTGIVLEPFGVRLETRSGTLRARAAILTVSTNVLASGSIALPTALTDWQAAASDLSLGSNEKVFLEIVSPSDFEPETQVVGNPRSSITGAYYIRPLGRNVVESFYGGEAASEIWSLGPAHAYDFATNELVRLFGSKARSSLRPLTISGWKQDPWVLGSYSCASPRKSIARTQLARAYDGRIFFAGEATHRTAFSTVHGAFLSGERAAQEALHALSV